MRTSSTMGPNMAAAKFVDKRTAASIHSIRRSTPDSEALASSDDDHDTAPLSQSAHLVQTNPPPRPVRRASWLSEVQSGSQARKYSLGSSGRASTSTNQHTAQQFLPATEHARSAWPTHNFAGPGGRQMQHQHLWQDGAESVISGYGDDEAVIMSPLQHDGGDKGSFPFPVPNQPPRKTFRSQSYSVGQFDSDDVVPTAGGNVQIPHGLGTGRTALHSHRPVKPSMLGDSNGRTALGLVPEDDDDNISEFDDGYASKSQILKTKKPSTMMTGSGLLKQASIENARTKQQVSSTSNQVEHPRLPQQLSATQAGDINSSIGGRDAASNRPIWHSSLGFGHMEDGSQSRRHSFAAGQTAPRVGLANANSALERWISSEAIQPVSPASTQHSFASPPMPASATAFTQFDMGQNAMNPFAVPAVITNPQPQLYIVTFKCGRSAPYYIPLNTGLDISVGDCVIVEGDRGLDLGTVSNTSVTTAEAKELVRQSAKTHYIWLMTWSKHNQNTGTMNGHLGMLSESENASAVGGMGPRNPPSENAQAGQAREEELKPRVLKRKALDHEINGLKEKEGAEAKAKRVATQKVIEHGLNMEILDAEFQYDWKKLTFYYYADTYVNFNELVTDLFKTYKTRIWMSAVNPASFSTPAPSASVGVPFGPAGGAASVAQDRRDRPSAPRAPGASPVPSAGPSPYATWPYPGLIPQAASQWTNSPWQAPTFHTSPMSATAPSFSYTQPTYYSPSPFHHQMPVPGPAISWQPPGTRPQGTMPDGQLAVEKMLQNLSLEHR